MWSMDDACLKCTLCTSQCPVYREDPEFLGPKALGPEWWRRWQSGDHLTLSHVDDCTFCQLCEAACPVGVPVAHLIAEHKSRRPQRLPLRLRDWVISRPHWIARFPQLAHVPVPVNRWFHLSQKSQRPIRRRTTLNRPATSLSSQTVVGLYVDCFTRGFDADLVEMARFLLELWGWTVQIVPSESSCCGAAAYASGRPGDAMQIAQQTASRLAGNAQSANTLITLNATCDGTIREEWPRYFGIDLPMEVIPFGEFAIQQAPQAFWEYLAMSAEDMGSLYCHTTCRGKVARGEGNLSDIGRRAGFAVQPLNLACCGAAGSYAFKAEHEEVAHRLGSQVLEEIAPGKTGGIMVDSGTCALHLQQITGMIARHPVYWLFTRYQERSSRDHAN